MISQKLLFAEERLRKLIIPTRKNHPQISHQVTMKKLIIYHKSQGVRYQRKGTVDDPHARTDLPNGLEEYDRDTEEADIKTVGGIRVLVSQILAPFPSLKHIVIYECSNVSRTSVCLDGIYNFILLEKLTIGYVTLESLVGIEFCPNLKKLHLDNINVSLAPLANLRLEHLSLNGCSYQDVGCVNTKILRIDFSLSKPSLFSHPLSKTCTMAYSSINIDEIHIVVWFRNGFGWHPSITPGDFVRRLQTVWGRNFEEFMDWFETLQMLMRRSNPEACVWFVRMGFDTEDVKKKYSLEEINAVFSSMVSV